MTTSSIYWGTDMKLYERYEGKKLQVAEKIQRRRLQLLVHSYIYYQLDQNIVSDSTWSKWAKELAELQAKYPNMSKRIPYAKEFADWDGSTGAFLEFDDATVQRAERLLEISAAGVVRKPAKGSPTVKKSKATKRRSLF